MILNLLMVAFVSVSFGGQSAEPEWIVERIQRSHELSSAQPIEISNQYGDVRLRTGSGNRIELSAIAQRKQGEAKPEFLLQEADGRFSLEVRFPPRAEGMARRADIVVFVPETSPVDVRTVDGLIDARGLKSPFAAGTVRGDVRVRAQNSLRILSEQGDILVSLSEGDWASPFLIQTLNGDIRVELPQGANLLVEARTSGEMTTDYSTEIAWEGAMKQGLARVGAGERRMIVRSESGNIKILMKKIH